MKTGADDDSLSTPTLALSASSARAVPASATASRPTMTRRVNARMRYPPYFLVELEPVLRGLPGPPGRGRRRPPVVSTLAAVYQPQSHVGWCCRTVTARRLCPPLPP